MNTKELLDAVLMSQRHAARVERIIGAIAVVMGVAFMALNPLILREARAAEASRAAVAARPNPVLDFVGELTKKQGRPAPVVAPTVSAEMRRAHGTATGVLVVGGVFALLGLGLIAKKRLFPDPDIAALVRQHPEQIVWVYQKVSTAKMGGAKIAMFEFVVFGLVPKRRVEIRLPAAVVQQLLTQIPALVPRATRGYSAEAEKLFAASPGDLLQAPA